MGRASKWAALAVATVAISSIGCTDDSSVEPEVTQEEDVNVLIACGDLNLDLDDIDVSPDGIPDIVPDSEDAQFIVRSEGNEVTTAEVEKKHGLYVSTALDPAKTQELNDGVPVNVTGKNGQYGYFADLEEVPVGGEIHGRVDYEVIQSDQAGDFTINLYGLDGRSLILTDGNELRPSITLGLDGSLDSEAFTVRQHPQARRNVIERVEPNGAQLLETLLEHHVAMEAVLVRAPGQGYACLAAVAHRADLTR